MRQHLQQKKTQEIGETEATVHIVPETIIATLILILAFLQTTSKRFPKSGE